MTSQTSDRINILSDYRTRCYLGMRYGYCTITGQRTGHELVTCCESEEHIKSTIPLLQSADFFLKKTIILSFLHSSYLCNLKGYVCKLI